MASNVTFDINVGTPVNSLAPIVKVLATERQHISFRSEHYIVKSKSMPPKVSIKCITNTNYIEATVQAYLELSKNIRLTTSQKEACKMKTLKGKKWKTMQVSGYSSIAI